MSAVTKGQESMPVEFIGMIGTKNERAHAIQAAAVSA